MLKQLQDHGIKVQNNKSTFLATSVEYLRHVIDGQGLHTSLKKVVAIQEAHAPTAMLIIGSFTLLQEIYTQPCHNTSPLNQLLKSGSCWNWSSECQQAFTETKKQLSSATILAHYSPSLSLQLPTDASAYGIGAIISHIFPDGTKPLPLEHYQTVRKDMHNWKRRHYH